MHYDEKRELYIYRVSAGRNEEGKLIRLSFSGKTQPLALEKYREWQRLGSFVSLDADITMNDWAEKWFNDYKKKIEPSSVSSYKVILAHIQKAFGPIKVKDVRVTHIEAYLERMAEQYSKSQCGHLRTMLGQILRKAEINMLIDKNPVPLADRMNYRRMGKKPKSKKDAYSALEAAALMKELPNTRIGSSIRLMLGTGISTQELLGLSTFDIANDGSRVSIRRAVKIKEGGGMYIGDVKAERRERDIDVPPCVRPAVKYLLDNASGYIIAGKGEDMPMHPSTYRKFYKSAVNQTSVRMLTPHCCRHTYISHLEDRGIDFAVIQALAGQSEQQSTINYIHAQSPAKAAAVAAIEEILAGKK
jgi:integrase